ncbi:hypothetical protein IWQ60_006720 [Tieghemiomyces parasiticus]|uniref:Afadin and alpha-actinin-binding-domain-containing protein n=1 Tax=Tieghemiomyces parasiticus TaxID=78921 RepID=A0A9W8A2U9_9FUNG|nr:hypothetical protein IWQ60_006720 [Tieghemiomyces parasiticus]
MEYREDIDDKYRRLTSEQETLLHNLNKLRGELETSDRNLDTTKSKLSVSETVLKDVNEKHRNTKEELKTAKNSLQYSRSQYAHELRKREQDNIKLKEKMQRMAAEKYKANKTGFQLLNPITKDKAHLGHDRMTKDKELVEIVLANYEDRERELLEENEQLRQSLYDLYATITELLHARVEEAEEDNMNASQAVNDAGSDGGQSPRRYREKIILPFEMVKQRLQSDMHQLVTDLKDDWRALHTQTLPQAADTEALYAKDREITTLTTEVDTLRQKVAGYKEVISEQARVIQLATNPAAPSRRDSGIHRLGIEEIDPDRLEREREALERQQSELDEERRKFTEAAILLGKEREELRREREALQLDRESQRTHAVLRNMPSTPHYLKDLNLEESTPELLMKIQRLQLAGNNGAEGGDAWPRGINYDQLPNNEAGEDRGNDADEPFTRRAVEATAGRGRRVSINETPLRSRSRASTHTPPPKSPLGGSYSRATGPTLSTAHRRVGRRPSSAVFASPEEDPHQTAGSGSLGRKVSVRTPAEVRRAMERGPCNKASCSSHQHHKPSLAVSRGRRPSAEPTPPTSPASDPHGSGGLSPATPSRGTRARALSRH